MTNMWYSFVCINLLSFGIHFPCKGYLLLGFVTDCLWKYVRLLKSKERFYKCNNLLYFHRQSIINLISVSFVEDCNCSYAIKLKEK